MRILSERNSQKDKAGHCQLKAEQRSTNISQHWIQLCVTKQAKATVVIKAHVFGATDLFVLARLLSKKVQLIFQNASCRELPFPTDIFPPLS